MIPWIAILAVATIGYLLGALPAGYLAGRLLRGVDIRELGSRSTGATNVLRTLGAGPFSAVLAVDVLKGVAAVLAARWLFPWISTFSSAVPPTESEILAWTPWAVCLAGLAALLGHGRPIWLGFRGGKSVAAGLGVLLAMAWPVGLGALAVFGAVLATFRIMSLGSIAGALGAIVLVCVLDQPPAYRLFVVAGGVYVIVRHQANIQRLLAGTEPRVGRKAQA